jgi:hypothetical protein
MVTAAGVAPFGSEIALFCRDERRPGCDHNRSSGTRHMVALVTQDLAWLRVRLCCGLGHQARGGRLGMLCADVPVGRARRYVPRPFGSGQGTSYL